MKKVSEWIADFLVEKNIKHVFGIIGAGNAHIFDAIAKKGFTEIVCVHHEQAAVMAMMTYYRSSGVVTAAILTTGAGSTNGVTGVVSAWMDSIPGIIISGNENSKFTTDENPLRIWGVQGYDSSGMVQGVTKYNKRVFQAADIYSELETAFYHAQEGRPGPCWLDVPMNIQAMTIAKEELKPFVSPVLQTVLADNKKIIRQAEPAAKETLALLKQAKRPVLWLGHGIRLANALDVMEKLVEKLQIPCLVSWAGADMIDSDHPLVFGRAGVYGQRAANFVLQNCDLLITIGTRLAIPQIGYDLSEFVRDAKVVMLDIDAHETVKLQDKITLPLALDAKEFMQSLLEQTQDLPDYHAWLKQCQTYRHKYPVIGPEHADKEGFINSYPFMQKLSEHFSDNEIIVTDMGTALLSGHQIIPLKKGQRLMTSTGLGEMGFGLPGAIGASFATNQGSVVCLNCDGGMMLNLQELQTIVHHQLPIKLFIFNNDGYLMIKHTQKSLFAGRYVGTDKKSGVTCPDYSALGKAFGIATEIIKTWDDVDQVMPKVFAHTDPVICEVFIHPEQLFVPKLSLAMKADNTIVSPPLEDLSPLLSREEMRENMIIGLHEKSQAL